MVWLVEGAEEHDLGASGEEGPYERVVREAGDCFWVGWQERLERG